MNENEILNVDDRLYVNPQTGLDETNAFIENLRQMQAEDTARINQQTHALGSDLPSNLGGLSGSEATFAERYQVPQTEQMIANLKATAQTQALNQALENTLAQYKNKYQQAYRNAYAKAMTPTPTTTNPETTEGSVETVDSGDYNVAEDALFRRAAQDALYEQIIEDKARQAGMTVEEYKERQGLDNVGLRKNAIGLDSFTRNFGE